MKGDKKLRGFEGVIDYVPNKPHPQQASSQCLPSPLLPTPGKEEFHARLLASSNSQYHKDHWLSDDLCDDGEGRNLCAAWLGASPDGISCFSTFQVDL